MDEIRIGIAGLGNRGLHWIRLLQNIPGYRIAGRLRLDRAASGSGPCGDFVPE